MNFTTWVGFWKQFFFLGLDICWIWASFYWLRIAAANRQQKLCHGKGSLELRFNRELQGPVFCWKLVVGFRVSNFRRDIKQPHQKVHWRPGFSRLFHPLGVTTCPVHPMVWTWPQVVHILGISPRNPISRNIRPAILHMIMSLNLMHSELHRYLIIYIYIYVYSMYNHI